jgi:hypothetical protein
MKNNSLPKRDGGQGGTATSAQSQPLSLGEHPDLTDGALPSRMAVGEPTDGVLADLARVKALFQLRAICAVMGLSTPSITGGERR